MGIISNLLFGDNTKKTSYEDALKDKYYNEGITSNYDRIYGGLNDYLNQNYNGGARKYKSDIMQQNMLRQNDSTANYKANRNNVFGNGIIGGLLNPIAQTAGAAGDLAGLALSGGKYNAWDSSKNNLGTSRDWLSDLGALGETALTVAPMAKGLSLAKAGKAVQAGTATTKQAAKYAASQVPKSLGQKMAGAGLLGAGFGAAGSLNDMGAENFNPGQLALSSAIGGGVGAGMAGLGGLWNKYASSKVPTVDAKPYQEALNNLKNNASGPMYSDVPTNLPAVRGLDTSRITLNNLDEDTLRKLFKTSVKNARTTTANGALDASKSTTMLTENKDLLADFLKKGIPSSGTKTVKAKNLGEAVKNLKANIGNTKYGSKVAGALKTKKGKVAAGLGGGLLLSQLMKGGNSNSGELTDAEMQELYNYIYGGGQ